VSPNSNIINSCYFLPSHHPLCLTFSGKAICRFQGGKVKWDELQEGKEEQIGTTNTANECAALVLRKRPEADGVVWGENKKLGSKKQYTCWATFATKGHRRQDSKTKITQHWVGCLINSMIISL
jgi:hypothetical protein